MAGDWVKVETCTPDKPEILSLAGLLDLHPDEVFGKCFKLWRWADSQLTNGNARGVTEKAVDALLGCVGFAKALVKVGWLEIRTGSDQAVQIPNFERHMGKSAKTRALTASRVKVHRETNVESVTQPALQKRYQRREEKSIKNPLTPLERGDGILKPKRKRKTREEKTIEAEAQLEADLKAQFLGGKERTK